ncbi:MAG: response regulator transcription factor [Bacteriovoracaceae bacterium]
MIFIIEDEPELLESLSMVVEAARPQQTVKAFKSALKAYEYVRKENILERVRFIITDQNMPGMSGIEFIKILRERGFHNKVFIFSGNYIEEEDYEGLGKIRSLHKVMDGFPKLIEEIESEP